MSKTKKEVVLDRPNSHSLVSSIVYSAPPGFSGREFVYPMVFKKVSEEESIIVLSSCDHPSCPRSRTSWCLVMASSEQGRLGYRRYARRRRRVGEGKDEGKDEGEYEGEGEGGETRRRRRRGGQAARTRCGGEGLAGTSRPPKHGKKERGAWRRRRAAQKREGGGAGWLPPLYGCSRRYSCQRVFELLI